MKKSLFIFTSIALIAAYFAACYRYVHLMPFQRDFLQGDAAYHVNINYNISQNHSPESTLWSNGEDWQAYKDNPFIGKKTDYTSSLLFWGRSAFTPAILIPLIYSFDPHPPMHILAVILIILIFGSIGISIATYHLTSSYGACLIASSVYLSCPWVVQEFFERGFWDIIGYGFFPLVLAAILSQRWIFFTVSSFAFAAISIPVAALNLCVAGMSAIFYRKYKICLLVAMVSCLLIAFASYMYPFCTADHLTNSTGGFLSNNFPNILLRFNQPDSYLSKVFFNLFKDMGTALILPTIFLLLLGSRAHKKFVLFAVIIGVLGGLMMLAREGTHRNYFFVTPFYFIALIGASILYKKLLIFKSKALAITAFTLVLIPHFFTDTLHRTDGPYVLSYATGVKTYSEKEMLDQKDFQKVIETIEKIVPKDKGIVFGNMNQLEGSLCNRNYCWHLGYHPKGAEYFIVEDPKLLNLHNMELVASFEKPFSLFLFKNLSGSGFIRNDPIIGFNPLKRALHF